MVLPRLEVSGLECLSYRLCVLRYGHLPLHCQCALTHLKYSQSACSMFFRVSSGMCGGGFHGMIVLLRALCWTSRILRAMASARSCEGFSPYIIVNARMGPGPRYAHS